jgi:isoleucyl-tRNA synthetase
VVAPQKVIKNLGADIIRLWVAATDYSAEMTVSDEILKRTADSYRRIRNTARYLLSNLNDFDPATDLVTPSEMLPLDRWAMDVALKTQTEILAAYESYNFHLIYQKVHNFCANEMGSLYLDITKDRQYTMQPDSLGRRSSQTAMYHIIEAMVRWIAPILTFTADELWEYLPGERNESVILNKWYDGLTGFDADAAMSDAFWQHIFSVRDAVSKVLESKRNEGLIKGGLTAEVTLYADDALTALLSQLGEEVKFVLITSAVTLAPLSEADEAAAETELPALKVSVKAADYARCDRCWHQVVSVGQHSAHPELCQRCVDNVEGEGEARQFA